MQSLTYLATTSAASDNIFTTLGIDWKQLIFQIIAFVILVVLLSKFVFPVLLKVVDERQAKIDEAIKAAEKAEEKAENAEAKIEDVLKKARLDAADIVATAKSEATGLVDKAESDAKKRADRIVAEAQETLEKDVLQAREAIKKDSLKLVKEAASLAMLGVADSKLDSALIKKSLESASR